MLQVNVEFWGVLASRVGKAKETVALDLGESSLRSMVEKLCQDQGPEFRELILDEDGEISSGLLVLVDGKPVRRLADPALRLCHGAQVVFTYPLMGG